MTAGAVYTLVGCFNNADGKGYGAGVAARIEGVVRLEEGQGSGFTGFAACGGQDRLAGGQLSIAVFDFVAYRFACAVQCGGKHTVGTVDTVGTVGIVGTISTVDTVGTVDGHHQRLVGGQGDLFGSNVCMGACSIAQFHRGGDGYGVGWLRLFAAVDASASIKVTV